MVPELLVPQPSLTAKRHIRIPSRPSCMRCKAVLRGLYRLMFHSTRVALHLGVRHHFLSGILMTPLTPRIYPMLGHVRLPFAVFGSPAPSFLTLPLTVIFPTSYQKILQFVFVVPGKVCSFVSIARFDNQIFCAAWDGKGSKPCGRSSHPMEVAGGQPRLVCGLSCGQCCPL